MATKTGCKLALFSMLALTVCATTSAAIRPYQWTPAQASDALMRQAEDFYVEDLGSDASLSRDLSSARCRGVGKAVQRRYVAFRCAATAQRGLADPVIKLTVLAKTRKAGGLCWETAPATVPSGCLAPGTRGTGSPNEAFKAMVQKVGTMNHNFRCWPNGAGFFSCSWQDATGKHKGTVVFTPSPTARVLS